MNNFIFLEYTTIVINLFGFCFDFNKKVFK